jgi:hypothetical protein
MEKNIGRSIIVSLLVLALMILNITVVEKADSLRAIHVVTLMIAGAAAYVLIVNVIGLLKRKG